MAMPTPVRVFGTSRYVGGHEDTPAIGAHDPIQSIVRRHGADGGRGRSLSWWWRIWRANTGSPISTGGNTRRPRAILPNNQLESGKVEALGCVINSARRVDRDDPANGRGDVEPFRVHVGHD